LADFLPNCDSSRGFLSVYVGNIYKIKNAGGISATALARDLIFFSLAGPVGDDTGAHTVIIPILRGFFYTLFSWQRICDGLGGGRGTYYDIRYVTIIELHCTFVDFFRKLEFSHNINFAERNSEAAMGRVGSGEHFIF
jgi:hypothetical protein